LCRPPYEERFASSAAICARRQVGHQHPTFSSGTGTAGGSAVHQQGSEVPSRMAQPNSPPQRIHTLTSCSLFSLLRYVAIRPIKYNKTPYNQHKDYAVALKSCDI
ncbi:hypothetical protein, partial [Massilia agri]|uniref:hypothetical protein n=1 Tax=Massilia agri TaxID=1886785 RepID=UPI003F88ADCF